MGFGQILFLLGAVAIIGPILIHLLIRPRFKRIAYTMIDFLEVSHKQSQAKRRLRQWFVLLMRCAIIILLACMFALPFLKRQGRAVDPPERHFIVVDNSLSMTYLDQGDSLLDRAIEQAVQYIKDHQVENSLFEVYNGSGDHLGSKLATDEAIDVLQKITPSAQKTDMTEVAAAINVAIQENDDAYFYMVSDFTPAVMESLSPLQSLKGLSGIDYDTITADEPVNALVKDARVLGYQNKTVELLVEIENSGNDLQKRRLSASVRDRDDAVTAEDVAVDLDPVRSGQYILKLRLNDHVISRDFLPVEISLSPADFLTVDDTYFLGVQVEPSSQPRVLVAGRNKEQGFLIAEAFRAISRADFDNNLIIRSNIGPPLDSARLDTSDIFICGHIDTGFDQNVEALDRFLTRGGIAVFFVSRDMSLPSVQRLYQQGIIGVEPFELIDERHTLSQTWPADSLFTHAGLDIDIARTTKQYTLDRMPLWSHFACRQHPETTSLWPIETGHYLIYSLAKGAGKSLLINTSIDDTMSTLTKRPVVIPLCRLILGSGSTAYGYGFHVEETVTLPAFESEQIDKEAWVLSPSGDRRRITVTGANLTGPFHDQIGWLKTLSDPVRYAGINVASGETNLQAVDSVEINRCLSGLVQEEDDPNPIDLATSNIDSNRPLWKLLAWIVIALVLLEGIVVNRIKR